MFRSAVLTYEAGSDPAGAAALLRGLASRVNGLTLLVRLPISWHLWPAGERAARAPLDATLAETARLRDRLGAEGLEAHVDVELEFTLEPVRRAVVRTGADVVVMGPFTRASAAEVASWADDLTRSTGVPVVLAPRSGTPEGPATHLLCPFDGDLRALAAVAAFLRDRSGDDHRVTLLALGDEPPAPAIDLEALRAIAGIRAAVTLSHLPPGPSPDVTERIEAFAAAGGTGVVAVVAAGRAGVAGRLSGRARRRLLERGVLPVIVVPALADAQPEASLDAPDVVVTGPEVALDVTGIGGRGRPAPLPDQDLAIVADGRIALVRPLRGGRLVLEDGALGAGALPPSLGLGRRAPEGAVDPLAVIAAHVGLVQPGAARVVLFDARLDGAVLAQIRDVLGGDDRLALGVRLTLDESVAALRARVAAAGLARSLVLDARAVLDEGEAADVPSQADAVRLCRVASRLRAAGVRVDAVVHAPGEAVLASGFAALSPPELPAAVERIASAYVEPPPRGLGVAARLDVTTGAQISAGNRVQISFDNQAARRTLLDLVRGARERVHLQVYIVDDDEVAREVAAALAEAAARGVRVRVLVDALYSLHGSYGVQNPVLATLGARPGVTVLASRPLRGLPTIEDLKQRDHRKILVVDGTVAMIGGRNLGSVYYRGFGEVRLAPGAPWRDVPWLDAGARVEGPAVTALDASFLAAWTDAGGEPFVLIPPAVAGDVRARVVVHHGLRDAYTLEAYLAIIDGARTRLDVVNGFPLQFEVQRALLRAVARGVRVRVLIGRARPVFGAGIPFAGASALHELANQLVHARMDALVEAGALVHELTVPAYDGWDQALREVRPHVHAKLVTADGEITALGSANLDVTAGYWESEVLLVVEDPGATAPVEAELDALFAGSTRLDPSDPAYRDRLATRAWLSLHWPSLVA